MSHMLLIIIGKPTCWTWEAIANTLMVTPVAEQLREGSYMQKHANGVVAINLVYNNYKMLFTK